MIKLSKNVAFIFMVAMALLVVFEIRDTNWDNIAKGINVYDEIKGFSASVLLTFFFMVHYVKRLKEEQGD